MPKFLVCNLLCLSELSDKKCADEQNELADASHCPNQLVTLTSGLQALSRNTRSGAMLKEHLFDKVRPYTFREDSEERRCRPAWHLARSVEGCPPPLAISSLGAAVVCACLVVRWSPHDCLGLEYCDGEPAKAGDVCVDGEDLFPLSPLSGL